MKIEHWTLSYVCPNGHKAEDSFTQPPNPRRRPHCPECRKRMRRTGMSYVHCIVESGSDAVIQQALKSIVGATQ